MLLYVSILKFYQHGKYLYCGTVLCLSSLLHFYPHHLLFLPPIFLSIFIGFARLQYNLASVQKRQKTGIKIFGSFICSKKNSHLEFKLDFMLIILLYIFRRLSMKKRVKNDKKIISCKWGNEKNKNKFKIYGNLRFWIFPLCITLFGFGT